MELVEEVYRLQLKLEEIRKLLIPISLYASVKLKEEEEDG
jgi:hypothetical protein